MHDYQKEKSGVKMNNLHVIFGMGPLGRYTAESLLKKGCRVRMISRKGTMTDPPGGAELVAADIMNKDEIVPLTDGAESIYQCAQPAYHHWAQEFPALQNSVIEAAANAGAKLIAAENLYMYGDTNGVPMTETTSFNPCSRKGEVRGKMTETLFSAHSSGKIRAASVRGSDFFGPWEQINGKMIFAAAVKRKPVNMLGSLIQPHTFTYVKDFGYALATAGTDERALGKAWHVPSGAAYTGQQLLDILSAQLGYKVKGMAAGKLILSLIGLFDKGAKEVIEMLYEFTSPFVMDSSLMEKTFGLTYTPMEQRITETLEWAKEYVKG